MRRPSPRELVLLLYIVLTAGATVAPAVARTWFLDAWLGFLLERGCTLQLRYELAPQFQDGPPSAAAMLWLARSWFREGRLRLAQRDYEWLRQNTDGIERAEAEEKLKQIGQMQENAGRTSPEPTETSSGTAAATSRPVQAEPQPSSSGAGQPPGNPGPSSESQAGPRQPPPSSTAPPPPAPVAPPPSPGRPAGPQDNSGASAELVPADASFASPQTTKTHSLQSIRKEEIDDRTRRLLPQLGEPQH